MDLRLRRGLERLRHQVAAGLAESPYAPSALLILIAALTGPVWKIILVPLPGVSLTFGRGVIVLAAVALAVGVRRDPGPRPPVPRTVVWLIGSLGALWVWVTANAGLWGCRCVGEVAGYSELAAIAVLAALVAAFEPRMRAAVVVAVIAGTTASAVLTLAGLKGLTPGAQNQAYIQTRAAGPYGNANFLAFALACGPAAALAVFMPASRRTRLVLGAAIAIIVLVLLQSYSRSGLLAAAVGVVVVLLVGTRHGHRRRVVAGLMIALALGAVAYPRFAQSRRDATSLPPSAELEAIDRSGWDATARGPIEAGPSVMANPSPGELELRTSAGGGGVSREIAPTATRRAYELRLEARALQGRQRMTLAVLSGIGYADGSGPLVTRLTERWRPLRLRWRASLGSPEMRVFAWTEGGPGFRIRNPTLATRTPGAEVARVAVPVQLEGSEYAELARDRGRAKESRDIASRRAAAELALRSFASQPVRGIGWGQFRVQAAARTDYGALPTHNEYLRFLAELGAIGFLLLMLVGGVIGVSLLRLQRDAPGVALIGILAAGTFGLLFINGLVASSVAMPLALAAGVVCATGRRRPGS